jgi:hypothetical protein
MQARTFVLFQVAVAMLLIATLTILGLVRWP